MLSLESDTFHVMFSDRWNTNKDEPVKIKDYSYNKFFQFITFLYSAQCELTDTNIYTMVDIAEFYGVNVFKEYCDKYLATMEITNDNIFKLMDLANKYSMVQLKTTIHGFITVNFESFVDSDGFVNANKSFIEGLVVAVKDTVKPEELFEAVYKWSENQAIEEQASSPSLNLKDTIKHEISVFLPYINFERMAKKFFNEFVVSHGFIFSSNSELSKILCDRDNYGDRKITLTNANGQTLHGNFVPNKNVIEELQKLKLSTCYRSYHKFCLWNTGCKRPSTPSPLKISADVEWYLIYFGGGQLCVAHCYGISEDHYILAELTAGTSGFDTAFGCKIEIFE